MNLYHFLVSLSILSTFLVVKGAIDCSSGGSCTLENYFRDSAGWSDRKACEVARVFFPLSEDELLAAVSHAVKHGQKVKVISKNAHTYTKFGCPNSGSHLGVLISTSKYNSSIIIDKNSMVVTADAGVQLRSLIDHLAAEGLALQQTIYWDGVSVSGMVSTGAHGSSLWNRGGGTYEYVTAIRFIVPASPLEGYATVKTLKEGDPDFEAARISLGVLGAISKVTFRVEPMFKRSITFQLKDDELIEEQVEEFGLKHEFGDLSWFPGSKKVTFRVDDRVPVTTQGEGILTNMFVQPILASVTRKARESEEALHAAKNVTGLCSIAKGYLNGVSNGNGLLNDGKTFTGYPVVGFNHKMQTYGGCQYQYENKTNLFTSDKLVCAWDYSARGNFYYHLSIGVPIASIKDFIKDVKQLQLKHAQRFCAIVVLQMRYVKATSAYLGHKEDAVEVEFIAYRDRRAQYPQPFEDVTEEIEQMMTNKYNGWPHYGKNRPVAFTNLSKKVKNLEEFLKVKRKMDPNGHFSSAWSNAVLGIHGEVQSKENGCALEGLCVCEVNEHCAPDLGYLCQPGLVYKAARVCKIV